MKLRYRPDIDGLRALAVGSVMLFHANVFGVDGGFVGVDIFFVISGYLITSLLFTELDTSGRIDFINFWARRTRRLMPSALLVIVATLCAGAFILSDLKMFYAGRDAVFATIYLTNWQKLFSAIDYFDDESGAGVFLHYWSLAVEEQFYVFLTLVFGIVVFLTRFKNGTQFGAGRLVICLLLVLGILSFAINIIAVNDQQPVAFFGTHARIWQLALGSGIAILERNKYVPVINLRSIFSWVGLVMMLLAITLFSESLAYPGVYSVLPSLGAALFILAGINLPKASHAHQGMATLPSRVFSYAVPVQVGKLSYALYLWHWPVYQLYKTHFGHWTATDQITAILITFALSAVSYVAIEKPVRFSRSLAARPITSLAVAFALVCGVCAAAYAIQSKNSARFIVLENGDALVPRTVRRDRPVIYADGCHTNQKDTSFGRCIYGDPGNQNKIFLVGDSHAAQWFPAVLALAEKQGFALFSRTKSGCISVDLPIYNKRWKREYTECKEWRDKVYMEIERERPALVFIGNSSGHIPIKHSLRRPLENTAIAQELAAGEKHSIARLRRAGAHVVLLADMPWFNSDPLECLLNNPGRRNACRWQKSKSRHSRRFPWSPKSGSIPAGVTIVDFETDICPDSYCYAAKRNVVTMRDRHHLTASYVKTLSTAFSHVLAPVLKDIKGAHR